MDLGLLFWCFDLISFCWGVKIAGFSVLMFGDFGLFCWFALGYGFVFIRRYFVLFVSFVEFLLVLFLCVYFEVVYVFGCLNVEFGSLMHFGFGFGLLRVCAFALCVVFGLLRVVCRFDIL